MNLRLPDWYVNSEERDTLYWFSLFTQVQVEALILLKMDIFELLDKSMFIDEGQNTIIISYFNKASGLFWFWVLGAFEITRTMNEGKSCFTSEAHNKISNIKKTLTEIRSPFAKQKLTGGNPIHFENCPYKFDYITKDYCYLIDNKQIWVKKLISEFDEFISGISPTDISNDFANSARKRMSQKPTKTS